MWLVCRSELRRCSGASSAVPALAPAHDICGATASAGKKFASPPKHRRRIADNQGPACPEPGASTRRQQDNPNPVAHIVLPNKSSFMDHFRWLRWAAKAQDAEVLIELDSMVAYLRKDGRHWVMQPRFIAEVDGVSRYFPTFTDASTHLAGWMTQTITQWPAASDKIAFKRAAGRLGLLVPDYSLDARATLANVVAKRATGSFGVQVHGPFRSSREHALQVADGEYFERFIEGSSLKIWFWGAQPVALERDQMPTLEGDGKSTARTLVVDRVKDLRRMTPAKLERILARCEAMLRFDGLCLDDVLPTGRRQRVEFRYGTEVMQLSDRETVDLRGNHAQEWQSLREAGPKLLGMLPEELHGGAVFSIDAIQDAGGAIHLLEMNSLPVVHPLLYDFMLASLIATSASTTQETPLNAA